MGSWDGHLLTVSRVDSRGGQGARLLGSTQGQLKIFYFHFFCFTNFL